MIKRVVNYLSLIFLPDRLYILIKYYRRTGKKLNLNPPRTFNEKLQWLKLYYRNNLWTRLVDKYEVKNYVSEKIGNDYVIPTFGVWNSFSEIDFEKLPEQFVLKCTHDSGSVVICHNKSMFNKKEAKALLSRALKRNFYYISREWPYKNVKPRIIAESFLQSDDSEGLTDYKFFCFNGIPLYCQVITERNIDKRIDFFDMNWKHQDIRGLSLPFANMSDNQIRKPISFEQMKRNAQILSQGIPFVRIDFYEANNRPYFGEYTFFPAGGFGLFDPEPLNDLLGDLIKIV